MAQKRDREDENEAADQRIRRFAAGMSSVDIPPQIGSRVFARVRQRRRIQRAGYAGVTVATVLLIGFGVSLLSKNGGQGNQLARETLVSERPSRDLPEPGDVVRLDPHVATLAEEPDRLADIGLIAQLSAGPPVVSLNLIGAEEYAMLDYFDAMKEESQ